MSQFCLNGCGYLQEVKGNAGKMKAIIKICSNFSADANDELYLHADVVNLKQASMLDQLKQNLAKGECILVTFRAAYRRIEAVHACMLEYDPESQIEIIRGELLTLGRQYVDGQLFAQTPENAMIAV